VQPVSKWSYQSKPPYKLSRNTYGSMARREIENNSMCTLKLVW